MSNEPEKVLVVDDDLTTTALVRFHLQRAGYRAIAADDGAAALQAALSERYDLVIADQQMPEMTGMELCRRLREQSEYADTPFIFLTSKALELDSDQLRDQLAVTATLFKPFSPSELMQLVGDCLSRRDRRPELAAV